MKEYNLRRHYETKRKKLYGDLKGNDRDEKFEKLNCSFLAQRNMLKQMRKTNEAATMASFKCSYILAKHGKPFTDGEIVKNCMIIKNAEMFPFRINLLVTYYQHFSRSLTQVKN